MLDTGTAVLVDNKGIPASASLRQPTETRQEQRHRHHWRTTRSDLNNVATKPAKDDYTKPVPVLGRDKFDTSGWATGFGTAKPGGFSIASTASSTVGDITWESWAATPQSAWDEPKIAKTPIPDEQRSDMWVLAYDLGWCNGVWTYRSIFRSRDRAGLNPTGDDGTEICNGSRAAPPTNRSPSDPTACSPSAVPAECTSATRDQRSEHVREEECNNHTWHVSVRNNFFYDFRENTFDAQTLTSPNVAEVWVNEDGIILQFRWYGTDRGIKIGSPAADIEKAYADAERRTCRLGLTPTPYFVDKAGRAVLFIISDNKVRGSGPSNRRPVSILTAHSNSSPEHHQRFAGSLT